MFAGKVLGGYESTFSREHLSHSEGANNTLTFRVFCLDNGEPLSRLDGVVAEVDLNLAQIHPGVEQMGGVGMPERMHGGVLVDAGFFESGPEGGLDAAQRHRFRGGVGLVLAASGGRKEPDRVVVGEPILSQQGSRRLGQRHVAVLAPFAEAHMQQHPGLVEIRALDVQRFFQTQAATVDQRQTRPIAQQAHPGKDLPDVFHRENLRQALFFRWAHHIQTLPLTMQGLFEEPFDAADRLRHRGAGPMSLVFDIQEILPQFLLTDVGGRFFDVVRQLAHGAGVGLLGARREALELQVLDEALPQIRRKVARSGRHGPAGPQAEGPPAAVQELRVEELEPAERQREAALAE